MRVSDVLGETPQRRLQGGDMISADGDAIGRQEPGKLSFGASPNNTPSRTAFLLTHTPPTKPLRKLRRSHRKPRQQLNNQRTSTARARATLAPSKPHKAATPRRNAPQSLAGQRIQRGGGVGRGLCLRSTSAPSVYEDAMVAAEGREGGEGPSGARCAGQGRAEPLISILGVRCIFGINYFGGNTKVLEFLYNIRQWLPTSETMQILLGVKM